MSFFQILSFDLIGRSVLIRSELLAKLFWPAFYTKSQAAAAAAVSSEDRRPSHCSIASGVEVANHYTESAKPFDIVWK